MNVFEQNYPLLSVTRCMSCCGAVLKVGYMPTELDPHPMKRALRDMQVLVDNHRCAPTDSQIGELEAIA